MNLLAASHGGGWADASSGTFPDELEIALNGSKTIDEIDLFTLQDNPANPSEPTETMTFNTYGVTAFKLWYWNGSTCVDVPGGTVTGNTNVWRKLTFTPITTSKIKVELNAAIDNSYTRITEVEAWSPAASGGTTANIQWLVTDQLGTPRMVIDKTGALANVKRHDYLPFGEELVAYQGSRTPQQGYVADSVRQQFTSKERDIETGLDYFEARYYSSTQGRFTSPDEFTDGPHELFGEVLSPTPLLYAEPTEPQSLNKYAYALGNPLRYVDPDGHQTKQADALIVAPNPATTINVAIGVGKEIGNIGFGMSNFMADRGLGKHIEPYKADNFTQGAAMVVTGDVAFFGGLIAGKPQVGGVAIAEGESTVAITARTANASRVKNATQMAEDLTAQTGKTSVPYTTPNKTGHIDLKDVRKHSWPF